MVELYNISDWIWQNWTKPPKGSRAQSILENPQTGDIYYFKESKKSYPSEVWSEIIASKIGQMIGFNVLDYNIAVYEKKLGCLSKSMILKSEGETLYHGIDILKDHLEAFEIIDKPVYSFQDLQKLCSENPLFEHFIDNYTEIMLFDALIGNTDRHTENWAFIRKFSIEIEQKEQSLTQNYFKKIFNEMNRFAKFIATHEIGLADIQGIKADYSFSPIYDSGSCLGREIAEDDITNFLKDKQRMAAYIIVANLKFYGKVNRLSYFNSFKKSIRYCQMLCENKQLRYLIK